MAARQTEDLYDSFDPQSLFDSFRRLDRWVQVCIVILLVVAALAFAFAYIEANRVPSTGPASAPVSPHLFLGNPSNATDSAYNCDNYLMVKPYFVLSYNNAKGIPNWVSWRVTMSDLGESPRKQGFDPDSALPFGFNIVESRDYNGSGFDRGHMCPHSDRGGSPEMSYATFVMTNVIPQAPNVNRKAWEHLESYGRDLVRKGHRLYIISGPSGQGGRGSKGYFDTLAGGRVLVPARCWKVIVVAPDDEGEDDLSKISADSRVIAVMMPNDNQVVGENWSRFRVAPAEIETETGYHFFDRLPPYIANSLRQKVDTEPIVQRERSYGYD